MCNQNPEIGGLPRHYNNAVVRLCMHQQCAAAVQSARPHGGHVGEEDFESALCFVRQSCKTLVQQGACC